MKITSLAGLAAFFVATSLSAHAAPLPGGASTLQETFDDWTVNCQSQQDKTVCLMRQEQSNAQTRQRVIAAEFQNAPDGKLNGALILPFGLDIAKGATLKIDDKDGPALKVSTCLPQGCIAPVSLDAKQVAALKAGTTLGVGATVLSPSEAIAFKISLKGFGAAFDRIVGLTK